MMNIVEVIKQGVEAHTQGDLQSAVSSYQSALEMDEANATAHNNLGFVYGQLAQWDQARHHLEEAIRLDENMAVAYSNLGQVLAALDESDEAVLHLRQSVELEPSDANHWNNLARICFARGECKDAEYAWHRALSICPDSVEFMVKLATTMVAQKRFDEAHHLFDSAIRCAPDYPQAWAQKGVSLFLEQNYGHCKRCLIRALELQPNDYTALKHLALVHTACGETRKAIELMHALCRQFPNDPSVTCDLAVMELSAGDKESARDRLSQLAEDHRDSRILYYYAVGLKETHGDVELTRSLLEEVQARDDEYSTRARKSLDSLS